MTGFTHRAVVLLAGLILFTTELATAGEVFSIEDWKSRVEAESSIDRLGRLYLEFILEEDPTAGADFGIHGKGDDGSYHDRRLPEVSVESAAEAWLARVLLLNRLDGIEQESLSRPDQIDLHILKNRVSLHNLQNTHLGGLTSPLTYVTALGQGMSGLVLRDYAPVEERLRSFGSRCAATGNYLDEVRAMLLPPYVRPTAVNKLVTQSRMQGMTTEDGLYGKSLPDLLASSGLEEAEAQSILDSCAEAVEQLNEFADWFDVMVMPREDGEWRLGRDLYEKKYALQMDYPLGPDELLAVAEKEFERTSEELVQVGRQIHDDYLEDEIAAGDTPKQAELEDAQVVHNIFAKLSEDRPTTETLIEDSYALAETIVGFVREQNIMDLPPTSKLRIEETPPHLAGNAVAQIIPAPAFEPELESVWFWDLELLAGSPDFLKEYNRPTLAMVYIHEGVPGHFVQQEYSNRSERIIPKVFWNGPMVEGWASYIATQLVDQGFTIYPDHPLGHELQQMVDDKLVLRSLSNAIIDIRFHTSDWSEEDAISLMVEEGFQEEGEAQGKLLRAKLGSVQLASYFAGHLAIQTILEEYREQQGDDFSWKAFNERLVSAGSPPFFAIREYMLSDEGN
jgi:uncharacterized protein (DUF885 family)